MPRSVRTFAAVAATALSLACGGSSHGDPAPAHLSHPALDKDYAPAFAGVWHGTFSMTMNGRTQSDPVSQGIQRTGVNLLAIGGLCPNASGVAGLDAPDTFSTDPITCAAGTQPCGNLTIGYDSVTGTLASGTLTMALRGTASCGSASMGFTASFTGTLAAPLPAALDVPAQGLDAVLGSALAAQAAAAATE